MSKMIKITLGLVAGVGLGIATSFATAGAFGDRAPTAASEAGVAAQSTGAALGRMTRTQLRTFADFPLYGGSPDLAGLPLLRARRVSPVVLAQAATRQPPVQTVGTPDNGPEARGHRMVPDYVTLSYGTCTGAKDMCASPLQVQIWRSCNRFLDDYEAAPGVPFDHTDLTIRGTKAAAIADRLEIYAGSVTIVIFAEPDLARRAADELQPVNGPAAAERAAAPGRSLPTTRRGPECA
jgi:hypothetical protein